MNTLLGSKKKIDRNIMLMVNSRGGKYTNWGIDPLPLLTTTKWPDIHFTIQISPYIRERLEASETIWGYYKRTRCKTPKN